MKIKKQAIFSKDKAYRYLLERELDGKKHICFIMLNPSIANEKIDDPTIRRVIDFGIKFNAKKIWIVNLFAFVTSDPSYLLNTNDPIGKNNDKYIEKYSRLADIIILGWGNKGKFLGRDKEVLKKLKKFKHKVFALKILKNGSPSHPLYLKKTSELIKYFDERIL